MSELLKKLTRAGLIEKLEGDDERFNKIKTAATALAATFKEKPSLLIRAVLAALDPDIPPDDPAMEMAATALTEQWESAESVYTDPPINLYRAMLLEACDQSAEGINTAILWNTAADTLPHMRLGKEEDVIRNLLSKWATKAEEFSLVIPSLDKSEKPISLEKIEPVSIDKVETFALNRDALKKQIEAAVGPQNRKREKTVGANQYWPHSNPSEWAWEFTDRMTEVFADQLDYIYKTVAESQNNTVAQLQEQITQQLDNIQGMLNSHNQWLRKDEKQREKSQKTEHLRLNTLWWSEALYSPSLRKSYRELSPELSSIIMALDLLEEVQTPTPASVSYVLMETVAKLPGTALDQEIEIVTLLTKIQEQKKGIPEGWNSGFVAPPESGRWSIRDLVVSCLLQTENDVKSLCKKAGINSNHKYSLPRLAQILFRQEHAVLLAEGK